MATKRGKGVVAGGMDQKKKKKNPEVGEAGKTEKRANPAPETRERAVRRQAGRRVGG